MVHIPVWALKVGCYYGLITCNTRPGVWPKNKPVVVAWEAPRPTTTATTPVQHTTSTSAVVDSSTILPSVTTTAQSSSSLTPSSSPSVSITLSFPASSSDIVSSIETLLPTSTAPPSTFVTSTSLSGVPGSSSSVLSSSFSSSLVSSASVPSQLPGSSSAIVSSHSSSAAASSSSSVIGTSSPASSPVNSGSSSSVIGSSTRPASSSAASSSGVSSLTSTPVPSQSSSVGSSSAASSSAASSSNSLSSPVSSSATVTPSMSGTSSAVSISATASASAIAQANIAANILVIARDSASAGVASSGLNAYGIPFTTLLVPKAGVALPALNSSTSGNFGGIVVASEVSYDYGTSGFQSALTTDQWNQLYAYQLEYGVRMVQYDVYPGPNYGATAIGSGCCDTGVEQDISFTDISDFPTSGLKTGAGVSTKGLWHYPATISNTTSTKQIASFAANSVTASDSVAAVINNFDGREQMAFFISFDTTWSATSNYLQHAWITWVTRGLYAGYRRVNLNTQIDDMFLETDIYYPSGTTFRIRTEDMENVKNWIPTILAKMNPGSIYFPEVGHNGNGNIENSSNTDAGYTACNGGGIEYDSPPDTALEFQKPLGTGTNLWPATPTTYSWSTKCNNLDPLLVWWTTAANLNSFGSISHTFTHEEQNNATYSDVNKEISFNQAWIKAVGIDQSEHWTSNGIIPPAITGLHNGDALQAWWDNGITNCVGDNTRSVLLNTQNAMWPYFTVTSTDGFDGMQVNPRWATRIYYNCDTPDCTLQEWIDTSAGSGTFEDLLATEKADTMRHLFGLHHDGYMFHQANLRNSDVAELTINGETAKYSIFQAWVETQVYEFTRLVDWPLITLKHQDMSASFLDRYKRDACGYSLNYTVSNKKITAVTVSATDSSCSSKIPVTFPTAPSNTQGFTVEQVGSDPATVWVQLSGSPVTFTLDSPIAL
ncbi:hypothetical protein N7532_001500 [Penicillium argentinense]|uniref:Extracellular serine-rich protein n=1 Tax=Penicillium argentinense TaxID=1131581 RepID=A0A9W9G2L5_9EURO|nr:uncharacterized protein N7532_001500 [Penicillium argentinense]KAJ5110965.1 hypothetical protein N7532_001500 [Penicillium argentinense]